MPRVVIVGCGFLGEAAADLFLDTGWEVLGICATPESAARLVSKPYEVRSLDVTGEVSAGPAWRRVEALVHCAGPDRAVPEMYRLIYVEGLRNVLRGFAPRQFVITASTSVYAQTDGSWVDETSETKPNRETGRILLEAEATALSSGGFVARLSGLYGPGRSVLLRRFLSGEALIEGDGARWINQIHRDDAARAVVHLLTHSDPPGIYNVTDNAPATQRQVYGWLADFFHRPLPPAGSADLDRKRGWTSKRVSNARLRKTGWQPTFPNYRDAIPFLNET